MCVGGGGSPRTCHRSSHNNLIRLKDIFWCVKPSRHHHYLKFFFFFFFTVFLQLLAHAGEPVWLNGKASGCVASREGPRFDSASALLSLEELWFMDTYCCLCDFAPHNY